MKLQFRISKKTRVFPGPWKRELLWEGEIPFRDCVATLREKLESLKHEGKTPQWRLRFEGGEIKQDLRWCSFEEDKPQGWACGLSQPLKRGEFSDDAAIFLVAVNLNGLTTRAQKEFAEQVIVHAVMGMEEVPLPPPPRWEILLMEEKEYDYDSYSRVLRRVDDLEKEEIADLLINWTKSLREEGHPITWDWISDYGNGVDSQEILGDEDTGYIKKRYSLWFREKKFDSELRKELEEKLLTL
jgi:hypothetical protein